MNDYILIQDKNKNDLMTIYIKYTDDEPCISFIPYGSANILNICNTKDNELIEELSYINNNIYDNFISYISNRDISLSDDQISIAYDWLSEYINIHLSKLKDKLIVTLS